MTEKSRSERGGRRRFNLKRREACTGWLFVSPALIGFSIFTFGSILYSLYLSFTDYNLLSKPNWLGLQNYVKAFTDDQYFYPYFGNTFYFVVALVPIVLVVSLLLPCSSVPAQHHVHRRGEHGVAVDLQPGHGHPEQHSHCHRPE